MSLRDPRCSVCGIHTNILSNLDNKPYCLKHVPSIILKPGKEGEQKMKYLPLKTLKNIAQRLKSQKENK